jgi:2-oxoglutarate dehydrogenase E1 component
VTADGSTPAPAFGANEWLVDEIYEQYLHDKDAVDPAWWDFFADYRPTDHTVVRLTADGVAIPEPVVEITGPADDAPAPVVAPAAPEAPAPAAPTAPVAVPSAPAVPAIAPDADEVTPLRGPAARVVINMEASLGVPTATSVRAVPATLLIENRTFINEHLARNRGGKVSFTHLIGWAIVRAAAELSEMNRSYTVVDDKPAVVQHPHVGLGLAIDMTKPDGTRQLLVPAIKHADTLDFGQFWANYEDLVRRARNAKLTPDDFVGTTVSLTNPGTIGTVHSVPRLMQGQGAIVGVGAMDYPAEYQGSSPETLAKQAIGKIVTLTSTYDHRIIQGAQSGEFLRRIGDLLQGKDGFYDDIFSALKVPYKPYLWATDVAISHDSDINKVARVQELIHAYRVRGHLIADTDPLVYAQRSHPDLRMSTHGLTVWDLEREFPTGKFGEKQFMKLRDIIGILRDSYARSVGIEFMHIQDPEERHWIKERVERPHAKASAEEQLRILRRLNAAEAFERFLQTKYVGQKRFSLEGSETVIAMLDEVLTAAAEDNLDGVGVAMPHRGRLNVLANIAGKSYGQIFREFEDVSVGVQGSGDVKYHLGTEGVFTTDSGESVPVFLAANPSHLEAVNPVLEGMVRAKQDELDKGDGAFTVLPILMHGDAAFAGQGVVPETLNLSQLRGYRTGGTVHIVVNNQVGFTTAPHASRSTTYATDVARMVQAPIFHVNGDDPEACVRVARLAYEFRKKFHKDVVIDLISYRRRGHNEADDPSLTQPLMYRLIDAKRSVRKIYTEALIGRNDITVEQAEEALRDYQSQLERVFTETRETLTELPPPPAPVNHEYAAETAIDRDLALRVVATQTNLPVGFTAHPRLLPQLQRRVQMLQDDNIDWATGEALAVGSLLAQGTSVRLAGQDSRRGTFGQRHMVIVDRETGWAYKPLKQLYNDAKLYVYDSPLSEFAAMGFEYGYSLARPDALVMWEAQFGDFVDGAQTIIDEFISSGEQKWQQRSSVTLLLPHGMEGQGPDHSSARIERFMQMGALDNMTIAQPSTPASYFHLLRLQALAPAKRPLIVFTPKSLLRHKRAVSPLSAFTSGTFAPLIGDSTVDPAGVRRILVTSGKAAYELEGHRTAHGRNDVAIVRIEQLYPFPLDELRDELDRYPSDAQVVWVQEEPANQGPWPYFGLEIAPLLGRPVSRASRSALSAPAVGSHTKHEHEEEALLADAFGEGS